MYKIQKFDDRGFLKQTWSQQHKLQSKLKVANTFSYFDFQQITHSAKQQVHKFWTKLKNIGLNIVNKFKFQNPQLIVTVNQNQKLLNLSSDKDSKDQDVCDERRDRKKKYRQKIRNRFQSCEPLDLLKLKEIYIPSNAFIKIPRRKQPQGNNKKIEQHPYWRKNRLHNNLPNQDQQIVEEESQPYLKRNSILQEQCKYENKDYNLQEHIESNNDIDLPSMTIEERELWLEQALTSLRSRIQKTKQKDCTHKSDSCSFIVSQSNPSSLSTSVPQQKSPIPQNQNNSFSQPQDSPSNNDLQKYSAQEQLENLNGVMADIFFSSDNSSITKLSLNSRLQMESQENRFVLVQGEEGSDERNFEQDIFQQQGKMFPLNSQ